MSRPCSVLGTLRSGSVRCLVVPLLGCDDDGKVNGLLPIWRATAANPRMGSSHRTSKDGGKSCSSKSKAVVPGHGRILPPKKKNAMRKIILVTGYAMRILRACPTPNTSPTKTSPTFTAPPRVPWSDTTNPANAGSSTTNHNTPGDGSLGDTKTSRGSIPRRKSEKL